MLFLIGVASIVIAMLVIVLSSLIVIPRASFGVVQRFGRRTGRVLHEGLHTVLPFGIEKVELVARELETGAVHVRFFSNDNLEIIATGSLQWRPSAIVCDEWGRNRFVEMDESTIAKGIADAIESELGKLASTEPASAFISGRSAVERLVNGIIRYPIPPHEAHKPHQLSPLAFYTENAERETSASQGIKRRPADFSPIELRYGIEIITFVLTNITFEETTKKALEKKRQVIAELEGVDEQVKRAEGIAKRLRDEHGLDPHTAINTARILLGLAKNQVITLEGLDKLGLEKILRGIQ